MRSLVRIEKKVMQTYSEFSTPGRAKSSDTASLVRLSSLGGLDEKGTPRSHGKHVPINSINRPINGATIKKGEE